MQLAILLYDHFTALDAVGPYEVLSRVPGLDITFVAHEAGMKRTDVGSLALTADATLAELPHPDLVLVPGGPGHGLPLTHEPTLDWLRTAHESSRWTISVCTGAIVLGAAGILAGKRATTHWLYRDDLAGYGAEVVPDRVVIDGKVITGAGVSAGIDLALTLAAELGDADLARIIQLGIEYDPQPPFDAGSPDKASPDLVEGLRSLRATSNAI